MTMSRLMLVAVLALGCNYYGPDNPPPYPDAPKYTLHRVDAQSPIGLATAICPSGSIIVSGGGDCVACTPLDTTSFMFGNGFSGTGQSWSAACFPGCAHAEAYCLTSTSPGTLIQNLVETPPPGEDTEALFRAALEARKR